VLGAAAQQVADAGDQQARHRSCSEPHAFVVSGQLVAAAGVQHVWGKSSMHAWSVASWWLQWACSVCGERAACTRGQWPAGGCSGRAS
jgi:hypothetical protein